MRLPKRIKSNNAEIMDDFNFLLSFHSIFLQRWIQKFRMGMPLIFYEWQWIYVFFLQLGFKSEFQKLL